MDQPNKRKSAADLQKFVGKPRRQIGADKSK